MQSYLNLAIEQQKNKNDQSVHKEKLGKIIQSLMSKDETSSIVKSSEHTVKVQGIFIVLEDDALNKAVQLPKALSKTTHFFHRGKPKNDGRKTQG